MIVAHCSFKHKIQISCYIIISMINDHYHYYHYYQKSFLIDRKNRVYSDWVQYTSCSAVRYTVPPPSPQNYVSTNLCIK